MNQNSSFFVSEWEWFKVQLRLYSLERKGELWLTTFLFIENKETDESPKVICKIFNFAMSEILESIKDKEELQKEYLDGWVSMEKLSIKNILNKLPNLNNQLDLEKDFTFQIMKNNTISSFLIASYIGENIIWNPNFKVKIKNGKNPSNSNYRRKRLNRRRLKRLG